MFINYTHWPTSLLLNFKYLTCNANPIRIVCEVRLNYRHTQPKLKQFQSCFLGININLSSSYEFPILIETALFETIGVILVVVIISHIFTYFGHFGKTSKFCHFFNFFEFSGIFCFFFFVCVFQHISTFRASSGFFFLGCSKIDQTSLPFFTLVSKILPKEMSS